MSSKPNRNGSRHENSGNRGGNNSNHSRGRRSDDLSSSSTAEFTMTSVKSGMNSGNTRRNNNNQNSSGPLSSTRDSSRSQKDEVRSKPDTSQYSRKIQPTSQINRRVDGIPKVVESKLIDKIANNASNQKPTNNGENTTCSSPAQSSQSGSNVTSPSVSNTPSDHFTSVTVVERRQPPQPTFVPYKKIEPTDNSLFTALCKGTDNYINKIVNFAASSDNATEDLRIKNFYTSAIKNEATPFATLPIDVFSNYQKTISDSDYFVLIFKRKFMRSIREPFNKISNRSDSAVECLKIIKDLIILLTIDCSESQKKHDMITDHERYFNVFMSTFCEFVDKATYENNFVNQYSRFLIALLKPELTEIHGKKQTAASLITDITDEMKEDEIRDRKFLSALVNFIKICVLDSTKIRKAANREEEIKFSQDKTHKVITTRIGEKLYTPVHKSLDEDGMHTYPNYYALSYELMKYFKAKGISAENSKQIEEHIDSLSIDELKMLIVEKVGRILVIEENLRIELETAQPLNSMFHDNPDNSPADRLEHARKRYFCCEVGCKFISALYNNEYGSESTSDIVFSDHYDEAARKHYIINDELYSNICLKIISLIFAHNLIMDISFYDIFKDNEVFSACESSSDLQIFAEEYSQIKELQQFTSEERLKTGEELLSSNVSNLLTKINNACKKYGAKNIISSNYVKCFVKLIEGSYHTFAESCPLDCKKFIEILKNIESMEDVQVLTKVMCRKVVELSLEQTVVREEYTCKLTNKKVDGILENLSEAEGDLLSILQSKREFPSNSKEECITIAEMVKVFAITLKRLLDTISAPVDGKINKEFVHKACKDFTKDMTITNIIRKIKEFFIKKDLANYINIVNMHRSIAQIIQIVVKDTMQLKPFDEQVFTRELYKLTPKKINIDLGYDDPSNCEKILYYAIAILFISYALVNPDKKEIMLVCAGTIVHFIVNTNLAISDVYEFIGAFSRCIDLKRSNDAKRIISWRFFENMIRCNLFTIIMSGLESEEDDEDTLDIDKAYTYNIKVFADSIKEYSVEEREYYENLKKIDEGFRKKYEMDEDDDEEMQDEGANKIKTNNGSWIKKMKLKDFGPLSENVTSDADIVGDMAFVKNWLNENRMSFEKIEKSFSNQQQNSDRMDKLIAYDFVGRIESLYTNNISCLFTGIDLVEMFKNLSYFDQYDTTAVVKTWNDSPYKFNLNWSPIHTGRVFLDTCNCEELTEDEKTKFLCVMILRYIFQSINCSACLISTLKYFEIYETLIKVPSSQLLENIIKNSLTVPGRVNLADGKIHYNRKHAKVVLTSVIQHIAALTKDSKDDLTKLYDTLRKTELIPAINIHFADIIVNCIHTTCSVKKQKIPPSIFTFSRILFENKRFKVEDITAVKTHQKLLKEFTEWGAFIQDLSNNTFSSSMSRPREKGNEGSSVSRRNAYFSSKKIARG